MLSTSHHIGMVARRVEADQGEIPARVARASGRMACFSLGMSAPSTRAGSRAYFFPLPGCRRALALVIFWCGRLGSSGRVGVRRMADGVCNN